MLTLMLKNKKTNLKIIIKAASVEQTYNPEKGPFCYYAYDANKELWYISAEQDILPELFKNGSCAAYASWGKGWATV